MAKQSKENLVKFLRKYSSGKGLDKSSVFRQWGLIEVRDAGRRRDLICPCDSSVTLTSLIRSIIFKITRSPISLLLCGDGRSGLRYLCFIRNRVTNVQTYVGSRCVRRFTNKYVPRLLMLMEALSRTGITGRYLGSVGGRGRHRFTVRPQSRLVRQIRLLMHFFSQVPMERTRSGWEVAVLIRHNQYTFRTPGLKRFKWYNLKLGPVTGGNKEKARPALYFYADRIRQAYK